jgi:predicted transcriptional regulator of viral defense system
MPIDIDRFEEESAANLTAGGRTNAETLLAFLADSPDKAFTPKEIHAATDVPRGSVGVVLSRLEDRGLVRHRGDYWAITDDDERLRSVLQLHQYHETATEQYGEEPLETLRIDEMERVQ